MIVLPAIELYEGKCVSMYRGDQLTWKVLSDDPADLVADFKKQGAQWLHIVDVDGAIAGEPQNSDVIFRFCRDSDMLVQVGGGIREMSTVELYFKNGADRVILGSAALYTPDFVKEAVKTYGDRIAVAIDSFNNAVAADGWTEQSDITYIEHAKRMEAAGVSYMVCTDIKSDGTSNGPNLVMLDKLNRSVDSKIIANGGISSIMDIVNLHELGLYGAIMENAANNKSLDFRTALSIDNAVSEKNHDGT